MVPGAPERLALDGGRSGGSWSAREARSGWRTHWWFLERQRGSLWMEDALVVPGAPEKEHPRSPPFPQISGLGPSSCIGRPQQLPLESPRRIVSRLC